MNKPVKLTKYQAKVLNTISEYSRTRISRVIKELTCTYYPGFTLKESDHGHVLRSIRALQKKGLVRVTGLWHGTVNEESAIVGNVIRSHHYVLRVEESSHMCDSIAFMVTTLQSQEK
jgi:hypothetical protein